MAGVREENRLRIALMLLGLGAALIFVGLALGWQHYRALHSLEVAPARHVVQTVSLDRIQQARLVRHVLLTLLVLTGIFVVSLYAFRLWSRRFRQMLLRKPAPPTPSEDVWSMHRLPAEPPAVPGEPPPDKEGPPGE